MTIDEMKEAIVKALTPYLSKTDKTFDEELLSSVVDGVFMDAVQIRRYPSTYDELAILKDLERNMGVFRNVSLARYNKIGAEGQLRHDENGIDRTYESSWISAQLLSEVTPYVGVPTT